MNTGDRFEAGEENSTTNDLPEEWEQTECHPHLPDGNLGTVETAQGTCFYDRDQPGRFIIGRTFEIGEPTSIQEGNE